MTEKSRIEVKPDAARLVIEKGGYRPISSASPKPPTSPQASDSSASESGGKEVANDGTANSE